MTGSFPAAAFVKTRLLREPIYREDVEAWDVLRAHQDEIRHFFRQLGQELVLDEGEGFAFLRQLEPDDDERVPRLVQRRPLSYHATLLLVCLREELVRFDSTAGDSTRLVRTRQELIGLVSTFVSESNNQVRDQKVIETALGRLEDLHFLRALDADRNTFEVMRIVKARITPAELDSIKERLTRHAQPSP